MSLVWFDSFQNRTTLSDIGTMRMFYNNDWANSGVSQVVGRRDGTVAPLLGRNTNILRKSVTEKNTYIISAAISLRSAIDNYFVSVRKDGTNQCRLHVENNGELKVKVGVDTTRATSVGSVVDQNSTSWHYIEWKINADSTGSTTVRVDGTTVIDATGDMTTIGSSGIDECCIGPGQSLNMNTAYMDYVIMDTDGSTFNDFLGDVQVNAYPITAMGNRDDLTGSDGNTVNNQDLVSDVANDADTSYLEGTSTQGATFVMEDATNETPFSVAALQAVWIARKNGAGSVNLTTIVRHDSTDVDSTTESLNDSLSVIKHIQETNPVTGAAWTVDDVNNAEFGVEFTI